jgi:hypothetical protein
MTTPATTVRPHPFEADRRALGLPRCRCGLFMGAVVHHPSRTEEDPMLTFDMEVDVTDRPLSANRARTHYVRVAVEDRPSLASAENEARFFAAAMGQSRGDMVTAVRITGAEL